jgi:caffeoyl-CoA O-methyltransferase
VRAATEAAFPEGAHMVSGHMQGRLFANLARLLGAQSVLEIGTFTGYSALCFAEGLPEVCTPLSIAWTDIPESSRESVGWERDFSCAISPCLIPHGVVCVFDSVWCSRAVW